MKFITPIEMPRGAHYGNNYFIVYSNNINQIRLMNETNFKSFCKSLLLLRQIFKSFCKSQ